MPKKYQIQKFASCIIICCLNALTAKTLIDSFLQFYSANKKSRILLIHVKRNMKHEDFFNLLRLTESFSEKRCT